MTLGTHRCEMAVWRGCRAVHAVLTEHEPHPLVLAAPLNLSYKPLQGGDETGAGPAGMALTRATPLVRRWARGT